MQVKITIITGEEQGRVINIQAPKNKMIIGRSPKCWLPIKDSKISGNHCEIEFQDGQFWVRDLGSTNGTFVNNNRIERAALIDKDMIQVGKTTLRFDLEEDKKSVENKKPVYTEMTEVFFDDSNVDNSQSQTIGNYRILEKVFENSNVSIYKAEHTVLKNIITLKVFSFIKNILSPQQQELLQEIAELKKIRHDGVICLYDVFWHQDKLVLVTDYVPGKTVKQILQDKAPLSWRKIVRIVFYIAVSLEHTHAKNIHHGSLTCSNVILEEGTKLIKLGDISLLKVLKKYQLNDPEWLLESNLYQPLSSHTATFSPVTCDLYSLGCILLFLLFGKIPEKIQKPEEWLKLLSNENYPSGLLNILKKTLVEPSYSSARECYQEIAKIAKESQNT